MQGGAIHSLFPRIRLFVPLLPHGLGWRLIRAGLLAGGTGLTLLTTPIFPPRHAPAHLETQPGDRVVADALLSDWRWLPSVSPPPPANDPAGVSPSVPQRFVSLQPTPTPPAVLAPRAFAPALAAASARTALPSPTPTDTQQLGSSVASASCPAASSQGLALALFTAINGEREGQGLPALRAQGCLTYVAELRAADMAARGYFSHTSPENETAFSLMGRYGVSYRSAAENLARNNHPDDESVAVAIQSLMESEGHRANILNGSYTHGGVAAATDDAGMTYYVMIFIEAP